MKKGGHRRPGRITRDPDGQAGKNRQTQARILSAADGVYDGLFRYAGPAPMMQPLQILAAGILHTEGRLAETALFPVFRMTESLE